MAAEKKPKGFAKIVQYFTATKDNDKLYGIPLFPLRIIYFVLLVGGLIIYAPQLFLATSLWLFVLSPIWVPLALAGAFWLKWVDYVRALFLSGQEHILLEIKIPRHIYKTPRAMELALTGMNVTPGETTEIDRWWLGKTRPWWSLEIVSIEGKIHFYIWVRKIMRDFTESQFYAQFPEIEIHEVEDYTSGVSYDPKHMVAWGMEFALKKPDAYPIKTYIDYELDKETKKAEQITDPISGLLEKLGAIGQGEMIWVQILVRGSKGVTSRGHFWGSPKSWKKDAQDEINKLYEAAKPKTLDKASGTEIASDYPILKPAELTTIKALERSIEKPGYDVGIRAVYTARPDAFAGYRISPYVVNLFNSFNSGTLNSFIPAGHKWHVNLDYPWQDPFGMVSTKWSYEIFEAYRRRSLFHPPFKHPRFVLTVEELATIFHFPSEETRAPGIERISSSKAEPPSNLPI